MDGHKKAPDRIAENKRTRSPFLDLGNLGLTEVPEEVFAGMEAAVKRIRQKGKIDFQTLVRCKAPSLLCRSIANVSRRSIKSG